MFLPKGGHLNTMKIYLFNVDFKVFGFEQVLRIYE